MIQAAAPVDPRDRCALNVARRPRSDSSCHSARCIRTVASMSCRGCTTAFTWLRLISSVRRRAASAAELGSKLLLRRGTPRGDPLRRLFLEMAQEEPQQVPGLPRRDGWRFSRVRRLRGFRPARLQVPEGAGQIVTHCGTGRQVVHVAFDHCFLHTRSGTQHDARDEPPHPMHGHPRRAPLGRALPHGNRQLDALWITRAGGRDQTERQARRARADRPEQLGEERAAEHGDLGIGVALERVERERDPQRCAVTEERALALGQAQLGVIGGERGLLHTGELAVALEQRPQRRVCERVGVAWRVAAEAAARPYR